jgi:hypothetical protein
MDYGTRTLKKHDQGPDVVELQIRLAGFRGTLPDGDFGAGTELQVISFQRDYLRMPAPSGIADGDTLRAIDRFADQFPIDFGPLRCPCGVCQGFGRGKFKGLYRSGMPRAEAFYRCEYPGIHRMLLWAYRGARFYCPEYRFTLTSGYRCSENNRQKGRSSTNHHGKAIDFQVALGAGEDGRDQMNCCNAIRGRLVETANAQVGWLATNRKSLEPENIAPTWVHYDVRSYERKYLGDDKFCTDLAGLDRRLAIQV